MDNATAVKPINETGSEVMLEDMCEVILHNDDHNNADFVVDCLMQVFGHSKTLAVKVMLEAHTMGRAIAEVECESDARLHCSQLISFRLIATIQKI